MIGVMPDILIGVMIGVMPDILTFANVRMSGMTPSTIYTMIGVMPDILTFANDWGHA